MDALIWMPGRKQKPFKGGLLDMHDFLVGNPRIQGSNLFVRLDQLCAAGCFDEALSSCTDRDLCLR